MLQKVTEDFVFSPPVLQREPDREEQPDSNMPPKFKRHLNDDEVTGSIRSERVKNRRRERDVPASGLLFKIIVSSLLHLTVQSNKFIL